jgi:hypothetical protein
MKAFPVVIIMTPVLVLLVIDWIYNRCCIQHCLEPLNMHVDLFIILGEMGVLSLVLNSTKFLMDRQRPMSKSVSVSVAS